MAQKRVWNHAFSFLPVLFSESLCWDYLRFSPLKLRYERKLSSLFAVGGGFIFLALAAASHHSFSQSVFFMAIVLTSQKYIGQNQTLRLCVRPG